MTEDEKVGWHHQLSGHELLRKLQELVKDREIWHAAVQGVTKSWLLHSSSLELKETLEVILFNLRKMRK